MAFDRTRFFEDVFAPLPGEVVTILYDLPHGTIADHAGWQDRRALAEEWRAELARCAPRWRVVVTPPTAYPATGAQNAALPEEGVQDGRPARLEEVIQGSTIVLAMTEYSATAPLVLHAARSTRLRVGSMPGVARSMEQTALSADYRALAERCAQLAPLFDAAVAAEVTFSTGHRCTFDLDVPGRPAHRDDGFLHPEVAGTPRALSNLPAGEVYVVPREGLGSRTQGWLPIQRGDERFVCRVVANQITSVEGGGPQAAAFRDRLAADPARGNVAEFAIGCNDRATVSGAVLEDEKAGFHWANGRSDHLGGTVGERAFLAPGNVEHVDWVYAKDSPIRCAALELVFADRRSQLLVRDGDLLL